MENPLEMIIEKLQVIKNCPFFVLEETLQKDFKNSLFNLFSDMLKALDAQKLSDTKLGKDVKKMIKILEKEKFKEYEFLVELKKVISVSLGNKIDDSFNIIKEIDLLISQKTPFWASNNNSDLFLKKHGKDEVKKYDLNLLENQMQLYALDYFLFAYNLILNPNFSASKDFIFHGNKNLPSLYKDAMEDDMLAKIVYQLIDKDLKKKMVIDYINYKNNFLGLKEDVFNEKDLEKIKQALKQYCLSVLKVSLENGIKKIKHNMYSPFKAGEELAVIKEKLAKS
ncbi:MAG TPA: hypothetical protein P5230_03135 [Candidatus Magasanikbacteria bacterium]|nr:hypothetical protein [Candidatus Magasanikbacteria bacterium]